MLTFVMAALALLLMMAMLAIRVILVKDGEFHGTCSTNSEFNRRHGDGKCASCGRSADKPCPNARRKLAAAEAGGTE
jgi:hypothetical protein